MIRMAPIVSHFDTLCNIFITLEVFKIIFCNFEVEFIKCGAQFQKVNSSKRAWCCYHGNIDFNHFIVDCAYQNMVIIDVQINMSNQKL